LKIQDTIKGNTVKYSTVTVYEVNYFSATLLIKNKNSTETGEAKGYYK
jgi:hypothetical protein